MFYKIIFFLFIPFFLYADNNSTLLDKYHDSLCQVLLDTSNSIDDYFIEDNCSNQIKSTTRAELISSFAIESHQAFEKDLRLRLRLSLPKIQKNLRLVFEDETNDNTLYDSTKLTNEHLENKNYYLRLEYFRFVKKYLNMAVAGGIRMRDGSLFPYLNIRSRYSIYNESMFNSELYNRFRYYTNGEIDNVFEFNSEYAVDNNINIFFRNQLTYSNKKDFQTVMNDISVVKILNEKEQVGMGFGLISQLENFEEESLDYIHLHLLFHHVFYKKWIYYEVSPSILWRDSNHFKTSYRYMMNLGVIFDNK
jgi:hypothetical protein